LETLDDIKGLKIRTTGDDGEILSKMGASVVSLSPGELYEAVQRGVIDAYQLGPPTTDWEQGMQEIGANVYLSPVRQPCDYTLYTANKDSWAELPDDLKVLVEVAFKEEGIAALSEFAVSDLVYLQKMKDFGLSVSPAPEVIVSKMEELADELYRKYSAEDAFYAEVYDSISAFRSSFRNTFPQGL